MFTDHVRSTILPLSAAGTLPAAFKEWHFTGHTVDHEDAESQCEMCGQLGLRYHFEIRNDYTDNELMVGSHCILRFQLEVRDRGRVLSPAEAKKRLDDLTTQMQFETALKALRHLGQTRPHDVTDSAIAYFIVNKALSPKLANAVFWQFGLSGIQYKPTHFPVQLRRDSHKSDFDGLNKYGKRRVWPALSSQQKLAMTKRGSAPPADE